MKALRAGYALLTLAVLGGWFATLALLPETDALPHPYGLAAWVDLAWLTSSDVRLGATLVQVGLLGAWWAGRGGPWPVLLSLVLVQAYTFVEASFSALPGDLAGHGKVLTYLSWASVDLGSRVRRGPAGRRLGVELASGFVAVLYLLAGVSKIATGGLGWIDGQALTLLVAERLHDPWLPLRGLRELVTTSPRVGRALLSTALLIELAGVAFLVPRLRVAFAVAVTVMHLGIGLFMGYLYGEWMLAVWGIALLDLGLASEEAGAPADGSITAMRAVPP